jgi:hypothetical protein
MLAALSRVVARVLDVFERHVGRVLDRAFNEDRPPAYVGSHRLPTAEYPVVQAEATTAEDPGELVGAAS